MEEGQADAPLLERSTSAAEADGEREVAEGRLGFGAAVVNLIKCIIGAGLLSIPMAFSLLGAAGGTAVFVAVVRTRRACVAPPGRCPTFPRRNAARCLRPWRAGSNDHLHDSLGPGAPVDEPGRARAAPRHLFLHGGQPTMH